MDRPYREEQVFAVELESQYLAERLHDPYAPSGSARRLDVETLEAIIYDGMIALREAMLAEEDD